MPRASKTEGRSHYFRGTEIVDQAIKAKQAQLQKQGLRPTESDIILTALRYSPYLFPEETPPETPQT